MAEHSPDFTGAQSTRTPEIIARDAIVQHLGSIPLVRITAQQNAAAFGDRVNSAHLVGAALNLGTLSHEGLLALIAVAIESVLPALDAEAAWAEHTIGFTWDSEEQRYGEYRAFLAGFEAAHPA